MKERASKQRLFVPSVLGAAVGTAWLALSPPARAVGTRTASFDSGAEFAAGVLDRASLTADGTVTPGPDVQRTALDPAAGAVWCIQDLGDGTALLGTATEGKILRYAGGTTTLFAETGALAVSAFARDAAGTVFAATVGDGKIFALDPRAPARTAPRLFVQLPGVESVWALAYDAAHRALFAATGPDGKLFAIDADGHATLVFDSEEANLVSLALDADGTLYSGASGHGIVYATRGTATTAFARLAGDEVKALAVDGDALYAAVNEFPEAPDPPRRALSSSRLPAPGGPSATRARPGRGAVHRIRTRTAVSERLYQSTESHITALEVDPSHAFAVWAALGVGGRIAGIQPDRTSRILFDVDETSVLALALSGRARLFGVGDTGAVYAATEGPAADATWTSRAVDATQPARWGQVRWRGTGALAWEVRTGNTDPPDATWGNWAPLSVDGAIGGPAARYAQVRARLRTRAGEDTVLRAVTVFYQPVNQRPVLTEVTAEVRASDARPAPVRVNWKVENPDADALRYRLRFRGDAETTWRNVLRGPDFVTGTSYEWAVDGLPEGFYRIEVEASDEAANPADEAERDTRTTEPVLVDNTPPRVTVRVENGRLRGEATDATSAVTRIEVAYDTQEWRPLRAEDGVLDESTESFDTALPSFPVAGAHVIAVRAYDENGNLGAASVTTTVEASVPAVTGRRRPRP